QIRKARIFLCASVALATHTPAFGTAENPDPRWQSGSIGLRGEVHGIAQRTKFAEDVMQSPLHRFGIGAVAQLDVAHSLMKNLPDQSAATMNDSSDCLVVTQSG